MNFKIRLLPSAQKELEDAFDYYLQISPSIFNRFSEEFFELNSLLEQNPFFVIKYNSVRTYKLKSFPYLVHFLINEELKEVVLIAIVFGKMKKNTFDERNKNI